jgi:hypothetical protein
VLGSQLADATINHVSDLTSVTVYAPQRLAISAPATHEATIRGATQVYHYRYTGLRLLGHTGGRYFLISELWKPRSGVIIVLEDAPPLRFEFGTRTGAAEHRLTSLPATVPEGLLGTRLPTC